MKKQTLFIGALATLLLAACGSKKTTEPVAPQQDTTRHDTVKTSGPEKGTLVLPVNQVEPGEEITVNFTAEGNLGNNAWIGIIPSNIEHGDENKNDDADIAYQYPGDKTSGSLVFVAPADTGSYDFRLNSTDGNGAEIASVTFKVRGTPNTKIELGVDKTTYAKAEQMVVTFRAPLSWDGNAWIGLIPAATKHGKAADADAVDLGYEYIKKRSKGTWKLNAPAEAGKYNIRMFDAEDGKEVKSVDFVVE